MRIPVATCARMILAVSVNAALELILLIAVAGCALHRRNLLGVRIPLDVSMAIAALKAAMNALTELLAVDRDTVTRCIRHAGVGVACQAFLRQQPLR